MGAVDIFRPTLGILNTAPASPKRTFGHHEWRRIESLAKRGDWPAAERRRATTISWLANPKSAELAKTWNWEDQQKMEQQQQQGMVSNEGRKVQRIYTRRGVGRKRGVGKWHLYRGAIGRRAALQCRMPEAGAK
jgi:hypothetical protein